MYTMEQVFMAIKEDQIKTHVIPDGQDMGIFRKVNITVDGVCDMVLAIESFALGGKASKSEIIDLARAGFQDVNELSVAPSNMLQYLATVDSVHDTDTALFPKLDILILHQLPYLEEIFCGQLPLGSFEQLREIKLSDNKRLGYLFSPSIANGLVHLKKLSISNCDSMESVFKERGEAGKLSETIPIKLPVLNELRLSELGSLTSFCKGVDEIDFPRLENLYLGGLPGLKSILASKGNHNTDLQSLFSQKDQAI
ncbi:hypothetical protein F0562_029460 [Nyssa sinensis]|uniref:Disease resistance protein At4g27190-like leucine-rich repeats domain-containing protein n=1 Tax=Nyssa sinensis TaxID=561372 RepID=A0A5J5B537_9ASTE|nr:hypothetical protein F0562_029460 [Nyssa sinensis]